MNQLSTRRTFKNKWLTKASEKASITDKELCDAIKEVWDGKCDNLGGGVFKKRLDENRQRAIILGKGEKRWFYVYLFHKNNRDNITPKELVEFRKLADWFDESTDKKIKAMLEAKKLEEICHDKKTI